MMKMISSFRSPWFDYTSDELCRPRQVTCSVQLALQCCCLCPPFLPQLVTVSAVLRDVFCRLLCSVFASVHRSFLSQCKTPSYLLTPQPVRDLVVLQYVFCCLLCSVVASVHRSFLSQWGFRQSCRMCSVASEGFGSPAGCDLMMFGFSTMAKGCSCMPEWW